MKELTSQRVIEVTYDALQAAYSAGVLSAAHRNPDNDGWCIGYDTVATRSRYFYSDLEVRAVASLLRFVLSTTKDGVQEAKARHEATKLGAYLLNVTGSSIEQERRGFDLLRKVLCCAYVAGAVRSYSVDSYSGYSSIVYIDKCGLIARSIGDYRHAAARMEDIIKRFYNEEISKDACWGRMLECMGNLASYMEEVPL